MGGAVPLLLDTPPRHEALRTNFLRDALYQLFVTQNFAIDNPVSDQLTLDSCIGQHRDGQISR